MKLRILSLVALIALSGSALAQETPKMVGGAPMFRSRNIVENAMRSKDHTTLVAAVKAAGLVDTLRMQGPFTVFAPTNSAFDKLPNGTVSTLVRPENKSTLTGILTYHVVPGRITAQDLVSRIRQGGGVTMLKTVQGQTLSVMQSDSRLIITDQKGDRSKVTIPDVLQSNGVIHVVDTVLLPS